MLLREWHFGYDIDIFHILRYCKVLNSIACASLDLCCEFQFSQVCCSVKGTLTLTSGFRVSPDIDQYCNDISLYWTMWRFPTPTGEWHFGFKVPFSRRMALWLQSAILPSKPCFNICRYRPNIREYLRVRRSAIRDNNRSI